MNRYRPYSIWLMVRIWNLNPHRDLFGSTYKSKAVKDQKIQDKRNNKNTRANKEKKVCFITVVQHLFCLAAISWLIEPNIGYEKLFIFSTGTGTSIFYSTLILSLPGFWSAALFTRGVPRIFPEVENRLACSSSSLVKLFSLSWTRWV